MTAKQTVEAFIQRINAQDPDGLSELMSEDHTFIDALAYKVVGREAMRKGWIGYFSMVPDYWIECDTLLDQTSRRRVGQLGIQSMRCHSAAIGLGPPPSDADESNEGKHNREIGK